jgi:hypothetical protein
MEEAAAMIRKMKLYSNKIKYMVEGIKHNLGQTERDREAKEMRDFYHNQMDAGTQEEVPSETEKTVIAEVDLALQRDAQSVAVA